MTNEPRVGEFRWQGEPQSSPIELWDGKQWVLAGGSEPTDEKLDELFVEIDQSGESESWRAYARAVLTRWGQPKPQGPTDEEILALSQWHEVSYTLINGSVIYPFQEGADMKDAVLSFARAVLTRWSK